MAHRYIKNNGELWEGESGGLGDVAWRTALAYIAYPTNKQFKKALYNLIKSYDTNGVLRHSNHDGKDTSRDAICMLLVAFTINDPLEALSIAEKLPYRISDRFYHTPGSWDFVKTMAWESNGVLFCLESIVTLIVGGTLNGIGKLFNIKSEKFYLIPMYTLHMTGWMLEVIPSHFLQKIAKKLLGIAVPKSNSLLRVLAGKSHIEEVVLRTLWQWQRLPWVKYHGIENNALTIREAGVTLDRDIVRIFL